MKTIHKDFDRWIDTNYSRIRTLEVYKDRVDESIPDTGVSLKEYEEIANCGKDVWFQTDPNSAPEDDPDGEGKCYSIISRKALSIQHLIDNLPERVAIMSVERVKKLNLWSGEERMGMLKEHMDHFLKVRYSDMSKGVD